MSEYTFDDSRRMLLTLLRQDGDRDVEGAEHLDMNEKLFLVTTCAAEMIMNSICIQAGHRQERALEGLDTLVKTMREKTVEMCNNFTARRN